MFRNSFCWFEAFLWLFPIRSLCFSCFYFELLHYLRYAYIWSTVTMNGMYTTSMTYGCMNLYFWLHIQQFSSIFKDLVSWKIKKRMAKKKEKEKENVKTARHSQISSLSHNTFILSVQMKIMCEWIWLLLRKWRRKMHKQVEYKTLYTQKCYKTNINEKQHVKIRKWINGIEIQCNYG